MRQFFIGLMLVVCLLVLSGCGERYSWNQKLTVEVQTPDGVVSASSITKIRVSENDAIGSANGPSWHKYVSGEAVVIPLSNEVTMFALLRSDKSQSYMQNIALSKFTRSNIDKIPQKYRALNAANGTPIELSVNEFAMFVTFEDINDPASVKEVNPNNLAVTFGAGYALKSITLEITDEPVTVGEVEKVLGWLEEYKTKSYRLNGAKCVACPIKSEDLSDMLSGSDFKIGMN